MFSRRESGTSPNTPTGTAHRSPETAGAGAALPAPVGLAPVGAEASGQNRYRTPQDAPATGTALASSDTCGTGRVGTDSAPVPVTQTATGTAASTTHHTGADMSTLALSDGLPADWITEDITTVTTAARAANEAGDINGLRLAFADLAGLTCEALDLLRGEELDAISRHDIPGATSDDLIVPNREELAALQKVARAGDYDRTMTAFAEVVDRIGMDAAGLLICQLITAGAAGLIEILDIAQAELEAARTLAVPVGAETAAATR